MDTSDCWIMNDKDRSPAFILADAGYDVFLGNTRGNRYSTNHTDPIILADSSRFFDFDYEQMGLFDVTA